MRWEYYEVSERCEVFSEPALKEEAKMKGIPTQKGGNVPRITKTGRPDRSGDGISPIPEKRIPLFPTRKK